MIEVREIGIYKDIYYCYGEIEMAPPIRTVSALDGPARRYGAAGGMGGPLTVQEIVIFFNEAE